MREKDYSSISTKHIIWALLSGFGALFIGLGICRFTIISLGDYFYQLPGLNAAIFHTANAWNFVGYLCGAVLALKIAAKSQLDKIILAALLLCLISTVLLLWPASAFWFNSLRFAAGIAGAVLMILVPSRVLSDLPLSRKGKYSGMIFGGVGAGIMFSSALRLGFMPSIEGLIWLLALLTVALSVVIVSFLFKTAASYHNAASPNKKIGVWAAWANNKRLACSYVIAGLIFVPHSLFFIDYTSTLFPAPYISSILWLCFGLGALVGAQLAGLLADRMGSLSALVLSFVLVGIALFATFEWPFKPVLAISALVVGAILPGIVMLTSARLLDVAGLENHQMLWANFTILYSVGQGVGGYGLAALIKHHWLTYATSFFLCALACCIAVVSLMEFSAGKRPIN